MPRTATPTNPLFLDLSDVTIKQPVNHADFTVDLSRSQWKLATRSDPRFKINPVSPVAPTDRTGSCDQECEIDFWYLATDGTKVLREGTSPTRGRVNACFWHNAERVSLTVRLTTNKPEFQSREIRHSGWSVLSTKQQNFPTATYKIVDCISDLVGSSSKGQRSSLQGLILFAGGTGSGKSEQAQALTLHLINHCIARGVSRRPHLATFEDPVEKWEVYFDCTPNLAFNVFDRHDAEPPAEYNFDFTARTRAIDVPSLGKFLIDAKRQTPACVYLGEIRKDADLQQAVDFAGSGHLVVATTHAGSLVETVAKILRATKSKTPAGCGMISSSLLACVHIIKDDEKKLYLPNVWLANQSSARNDFVTTGLGSIVPNNSYVLSRRQFLDRAIKHWDAPGIRVKVDDATIRSALTVALNHDLKDF